MDATSTGQPGKTDSIATSTRMKPEILRDWNAVLTLRDEWNELLDRSDAHALFFSWEWMESWIEIARDVNTPFFIVIRDPDNRLLGVAPFYTVKAKLIGLIDYKILRLAGDHSTGFEYADLIASKENPNGVLKEIGVTLHKYQTEWDLIWLPKIAGWSHSLERIRQATTDSVGFAANTRQTDFSSIPLPASFEEYENRFSSKRRNHHKRTGKRVLNEPSTRFTNCTHPEELDHFLDTLFTLHHKRRMLLSDPGTFIRRPSQVSFYRSFTLKALKRGWLRINAIESAGQIQAIQLGYVCCGAYLQMQEGFNPDFTHGSGNVLRRHTISLCIDEGLQEYDFLGGMTEHKRRWGAVKRTGCDMLIGSQKLKSRLLLKFEVWPTGRYLKQLDLID